MIQLSCPPLHMLALCAVLVTGGSAFAQDAPPVPLPEPLKAAFHAAMPFEDQTPSFTVRASVPGDGSFLFRFDREAGWTVLEGDFDTLSDRTKAEISEMQTQLAEPGALLYGSMADDLISVSLAQESADALIYDVMFRDEDGKPMPRQMREAMTMQLTLDRSGGYIRTVSLQADKPFKPAAIAKIEEMEVRRSYAPVEPGGPALLNAVYNKVAGSAMFRKFDEEYTLEFSDISFE